MREFSARVTKGPVLRLELGMNLRWLGIFGVCFGAMAAGFAQSMSLPREGVWAKPITAWAKHQPLRLTIQDLARAGLPVTIHPILHERKVAIFVKDRPAYEVLTNMAEALDLDWKLQGDNYFLTVREELLKSENLFLEQLRNGSVAAAKAELSWRQSFFEMTPEERQKRREDIQAQIEILRDDLTVTSSLHTRLQAQLDFLTELLKAPNPALTAFFEAISNGDVKLDGLFSTTSRNYWPLSLTTRQHIQVALDSLGLEDKEGTSVVPEGITTQYSRDHDRLTIDAGNMGRNQISFTVPLLDEPITEQWTDERDLSKHPAFLVRAPGPEIEIPSSLEVTGSAEAMEQFAASRNVPVIGEGLRYVGRTNPALSLMRSDFQGLLKSRGTWLHFSNRDQYLFFRPLDAVVTRATEPDEALFADLEMKKSPDLAQIAAVYSKANAGARARLRNRQVAGRINAGSAWSSDLHLLFFHAIGPAGQKAATAPEGYSVVRASAEAQRLFVEILESQPGAAPDYRNASFYYSQTPGSGTREIDRSFWNFNFRYDAGPRQVARTVSLVWPLR